MAATPGLTPTTAASVPVGKLTAAGKCLSGNFVYFRVHFEMEIAAKSEQSGRPPRLPRMVTHFRGDYPRISRDVVGPKRCAFMPSFFLGFSAISRVFGRH